MGTLEQVTQMRKERKTNEEIISELKKQGVSPKEINEALNHAQIKNAVSDIRGENAPSPPLQENIPPLPQENQDAQKGDTQENYNQDNYQQNQGYNQQENYNPQESYNQSNQEQVYNPPPQNNQEFYPQQDGYQDYSNSGQYPQQNTNADTIVEISEQVFDEKINKITKKIDSIEEFKTLTQTKLDHLTDKVKRIESVMDKLQIAILEKIGSYGKNLETIKKEMSMVEDSFAKTLNPLLDIAKHKSPSKDKEKSEKKNSKKK